MSSYDLYTLETGDVDVAKERCEIALDVVLSVHESSYWGGAYYRGRGPGDEEIVIRRNLQDDEGYLAEADCPEGVPVLYVNETLRHEECRKLLEGHGFALVRHEEM